MEENDTQAENDSQWSAPQPPVAMATPVRLDDDTYHHRIHRNSMSSVHVDVTVTDDARRYRLTTTRSDGPLSEFYIGLPIDTISTKPLSRVTERRIPCYGRPM